MTALRTTIVSLSFTLLTAASALAGPPLATDDAGTVDVGKVEVELNGSYTHDKENAAGVTTKTDRHESEMKVSTGLHKDLGISLTAPYTFSARENVNGDVSKVDGFGDMTVELKYAFAERGGIKLAIKPSVILPTGKSDLSENHWQYGATLIATKEFEEGKYAMHANLGYEYHTYKDSNEGMRRNLWSASLAGEAELVKGFIAVADFGLASNEDKASNDLPVYALAGARYEINDNLEVNAGVKLGLTKQEDDISVLYGLLLKF